MMLSINTIDTEVLIPGGPETVANLPRGGKVRSYGSVKTIKVSVAVTATYCLPFLA